MPTIVIPTTRQQSAEGVVIATGLTAGALTANHTEGVVIATGVTAGALTANHVEVLVGG
jgi:hypothetical protein